jgi:FkbM family methyltransferase
MKRLIRDFASAALRSLPKARGKGSVGSMIDKALGCPRGADAVRWVKMRDGSILRLDTRNSAEKWAYWTGQYDTEIRDRLLSVCPPGANVLDIGANVGLWSVPIGMSLRKSGGCVWAFEPVPNNFEILNEQIRNNNLGKIVQPVRIALGETSGVARLAIVESDAETLSGNAKIVAPTHGGRTFDAPMMPLDTWADQNGVNACHMLKIDVEGAELGVLRGGMSFIRKHRPVIFGEFNAYWMMEAGQSFCDVAELILPLEYRAYQRAGAASFTPMREPIPGAEDVLLLPAEAAPQTLERLGVATSSAG